MSIIRSMIKTRRCFSRKQKFRERDEKTNKFFSSSSSSSVVLRRRRSTTNNERRQTDRQILSSLSLSLSLFLPFTDERTKRRSQEDKREAAFRTKPSLLILKVRSSSERSNFILPRVVRCFRSQRSPPFLSSSSNVMMRKKEVYTRAS